MREPVTSGRLLAWLSWSLLVFGIGAWVSAVLLDSPPYATPSDATWAISFSCLLLVGFILTRRIPSNLFGWLMTLTAGLAGAGVALDEAGASPADGVFESAMIVAITSLYIFPDGKAPPVMWRVVYLGALVGLVVVAPLLPPSFGAGIASVAFGALAFGALGALTQRAIRGRPIVRRQIGLPMMVIVIGWLVLLSTPYLAQFVSALGVDRGWVEIASTLVLTIGLPVSLGVSISRYRLYDMGRLVSRTVSYALVLGVLALVVLGLVTVFAAFVPSDDPLVVAVATLAAAALFNPVRRRVQSVIDRRFNRSRYDAQRVIGSFTETLQEQIDPDEVVEGWVEVAGESMQPSAVGFWVKEQ